MKRMSDYVRSKGREVIGWDELTNSSFLPEGVIIQGWRGLGAAALKAAEKGHRFIMTPARIMYRSAISTRNGLNPRPISAITH